MSLTSASGLVRISVANALTRSSVVNAVNAAAAIAGVEHDVRKSTGMSVFQNYITAISPISGYIEWLGSLSLRLYLFDKRKEELLRWRRRDTRRCVVGCIYSEYVSTKIVTVNYPLFCLPLRLPSLLAAAAFPSGFFAPMPSGGASWFFSFDILKVASVRDAVSVGPTGRSCCD